MILLSFAARGEATETLYRLDMPSLKVNDALDYLASKTNHSLFYLASEVPGIQTKPLEGVYTVRDALKTLLADTGLHSVVTKRDVIVVSATQKTDGGDEMSSKSVKSSMFAALALSVAANPVSVRAQAVTGEGGAKLEEIVVTAQMREENIQEVPIAISAFDSASLDELGINDIRDLQLFVPGLTVVSENSPVQTSINLRGVGTPGDNWALESSVGLYVDGVYRSRQSSALNNLVDIQRVEVLKGPQGTLFGKNTTSGAIQYITVAPDLNDYGGYSEVSAGNLAYLNANGAINIPVVEGKAAARISGGISTRDGYVRNIVTGEDQNDLNRFALRGQFLLAPSEALSVRIIADYQQMDEKCCSQSVVLNSPRDLYMRDTLGATIVLQDRFDDDISAADVINRALIEESGLSAEVNWRLDAVTLTSITAYRKFDSENFFDGDSTDLFTLNNNWFASQDTFTQEFRVTGSVGKRFKYIGGAYYFDQELDARQELPLGPDLNPLLGNPTNASYLTALGTSCAAAGVAPADCTAPVYRDGDLITNFENQKQSSWALFAQGDVGLTDDLILTLGLRYLDEQKELSTRFIESRYNPAWAVIGFTSPVPVDIDGRKFSDSALTGTAKLAYRWSDDVMTFMSYGHGYKSGGTNGRRLPPGVPVTFNPETVDSYEIGLKADFLDNRLRLNASVFHMEFDDFQAQSFNGAGGFILRNAGKITSEGAELDLSFAATDWLTLTTGGAYVDAIYDRFDRGPCIQTPAVGSPDAGQPNFPTFCDLSGRRVQGTPEWAGYGSAYAKRYVANGNMLYGQLDVSWRDDTPIGPENDPNKTVDSYTLTNLRLGYEFGGGRYDVSLWSKNLFDVDYRKGPYNSTLRAGGLMDNHTEPRTFGVTLRAKM